jgi:hypothetical protein
VEEFVGAERLDLKTPTRATGETVALIKANHVGTYSFESMLIVKVPEFIA